MCWRREEHFKKNDGGILTMFALSLRPLWDRDIAFSIYVPFTPKMHRTKFEQNWLNGFRKKLKCLIGNTQGLSHDSRQRRTTTDDDGRKPIPVDHLIDPGYLKITTKKTRRVFNTVHRKILDCNSSNISFFLIDVS